MEITAKELGKLLNGTVEGDPEVSVNRPSKIEEGGKGTITFLANPKYEQYAYSTTASILLVNHNFRPQKAISATLIRVEDVYSSIALLLDKFGASSNGATGISKNAFIHPDSKLAENVAVGEFSVISKGAIIGAQTVIHAQVFIGEGVVIGENCVLFPGVRIQHHCSIGNNCILHSNAVIGTDGFGFAQQQDGSFKKIAQIGNVLIEDNVEIGACCTVDRATMGNTIIRKGVKLDNLVQIGHNVEIGENTVIAAQAGVAGSTKIGKNCMIGGQVGFAGHLKIADGTKVQAQSGISGNIENPNTTIFGSPAINYNDYIKSYAVFKKLPELYKKLHELEQKLAEKKQD